MQTYSVRANKYSYFFKFSLIGDINNMGGFFSLGGSGGGGGGSVDSVTGSSPITSSGGSNPVIGITAFPAPDLGYTPAVPGNWPDGVPTTIQQALDELAAENAASGTMTAAYVMTFTTGTWVATMGQYQITIPASTHMKTAPLTVYVEQLVGNEIGGADNDYQVIEVQTDIDPGTLEVGIVVPDAPSTFTGRITITGSN
jgi:hypothetical protein